MADDDQKDDSAPDPWADILSGDSAESQPDLAFSFDEPANIGPGGEPPSNAGETLPPGATAGEPDQPAPINDEPAAMQADARLDDDLVGAWLDEAEPVVAEPVADEIAQNLAAESSAVEIGTGSSGIVAAEEIDVWADESSASDAPSADADAPSDAFAFTSTAEADAGAGDADESVPFTAAPADESSAFTPSEVLDESPSAAPVLAGAAAGAVMAGSAPRKAAKPAKAAKGGLGQMIGLVLGGAMAFPIVGGILIGLMWAGVPVPVGRSIGRALPESMAFIVPEKYRPGFKKAGGFTAAGSSTGSPLDALGTGNGPTTDEPAMEETSAGVDAVADLAVDEPQPSTAGEPVVDDTPVVPGDGETFEDPLAATTEPAAPAPLDAERAAAEAKRLAAEAAAADRQQLDAAVEEALTALASVEEVADVEDPSRKTLLVDLYKALAKVGAELVMLERISADAGRPLVEPPQSLLDIHGRIGRHRDDLVRLGRNWLDYAKRPSDGVVLPVTFQSARKVGPYWSARVTLALPKGATRELTVLSRAEPAAVQGDAVMLTGMVFDGDVVWAADVRPLAAQGGGFGGGF